MTKFTGKKGFLLMVLGRRGVFDKGGEGEAE